ncbi:mechanosensitive ion channel domain-containing protein [Vibrio caribbeanicus]|uniref:mechanosensitive ion channel domain-containing protein n=1 Tax=Vibrio caribbeanicus TaxID=701175 RepID=UPI0039903C64
MAAESEQPSMPIISEMGQFGGWLTNHSDLIIQYCVNIIAAVLILFVGYLLSKAIANGAAKVLHKKNMDKAVVQFIHGLLRYALFAIVFVAALSRLGVQTASVVAVIGAAGLAIGLALQGSLSNFAAGILIVIFRPFKSGDYVQVSGVGGSVDSIQIFQTILTTPDNKMVVVPNSSVIGSPITNYSRHKTRRIDLVIGVSYSADLNKVKSLLLAICEADSRVLSDPGVVVGVQALADSSVNFVVRPWVNTSDYWGVYFDLLQSIKESLDKEGIEIPFPQMNVHLNKVES